MKLSVLKDIFSKNKKVILILIAAFLIFHLEFSFAAEATNTGNDIGFIDILNGGIQIIGLLLGLMTQFVGLFLTPEWTTGSIIGFGNHLKSLWILVSNVVYFIFAFLLIWIAFMNILGKGDHWELKQALPKFIVGVLIVPLSWFFVQFVISITSILTVATLSLPYDSFSQDYEKAFDGVEFCTGYTVHTNYSEEKSSIVEEGYTTEDAKDFLGPPIECTGEEITLKEYIQNSDSLFGIMSIYTYSVMKLDTNGELYKNDIVLKKVNDILNLSVKGVLDVIFIIVYFILMMALLMALFVRGVYMWIFTVISPVFGLMYFFGDKSSEALKKFSIKNFIGLALLPVYVSAALSFGLLFILVAGQGFSVGENGSMSDGGSFITNGGDTVEFAGVSVTFDGAKSDSTNSVGDTAGALLGTFQGAFGILILQFFGLAVLWISVMAALKSSDITKEVVQPIAQFGESVGSLVAKAPTYAPIFPGGQSAKSMASAASQVSSTIESRQTSKASKFLEAHGFSDSTKISDIEKIKNGIKARPGDIKSINQHVQSLIKTVGDYDQLRAISQSREAIYEALKGAPGGVDALKALGINSANDLSSSKNMDKVLGKLDEIGEQNHANLFEKHFGEVEKSARDAVNDLAKNGGPTIESTPSNLNNGVRKIDINIDGRVDNTGSIVKEGNDFNSGVVSNLVTQIMHDINKGTITKDEFKEILIDSVAITDKDSQDILIEGIIKKDKDYFKKDNNEN